MTAFPFVYIKFSAIFIEPQTLKPASILLLGTGIGKNYEDLLSSMYDLKVIQIPVFFLCPLTHSVPGIW